MFGLALGAWGAVRWRRPVLVGAAIEPEKGLSNHELHEIRKAACTKAFALGDPTVLVALLAFVLPGLLAGLARLGNKAGASAEGGLLFYAFALAFVVGAQFALANRFAANAARSASRFYTADFLGASLGALLASTLLLPLAGVTGVCVITGGLNLLAVLVFLRQRSFA